MLNLTSHVLLIQLPLNVLTLTSIFLDCAFGNTIFNELNVNAFVLLNDSVATLTPSTNKSASVMKFELAIALFGTKSKPTLNAFNLRSLTLFALAANLIAEKFVDSTISLCKEVGLVIAILSSHGNLMINRPPFARPLISAANTEFEVATYSALPGTVMILELSNENLTWLPAVAFL